MHNQSRLMHGDLLFSDSFPLTNQFAPSELIGLRVAKKQYWLDASGTGIHMTLPYCHTKFLTGGSPDGGLVLNVRNGQLPSRETWRPLYYPSDTWEMWLDEQGNYVFVAPKVSPPKRHVVVNEDFTVGEVIGEFTFSDDNQPTPFPLQNVEIIFFTNWLACFGDMILHAAGMDVDGQGYCFVGSHGAGKSTLTASLAAASREEGALEVLGEDNLILRCQGGQFWIYGTPWHLNPGMCSPRGVLLKKLFFLDRTAGQQVEPLSPIDGISRLLQTAFIPYYRPEAVSDILDRLALLASQVPFYTFGYRLGSDIYQLIHQTW